MFGTLRSLPATIALSFTVFYLAGCSSAPVVEATTDSSVSPTADLLVIQQLNAVDEALAVGDTETAERRLNELVFDRLSQPEQLRYVIARADIALLNNEGQQAAQWLGAGYAPLFDALSLAEQVSISLKRAQAFELAGRPLASARERIFLAPLLLNDEREENHEKIWFNLQSVPTENLSELASNEASPDFQGWLELALIHSNNTSDLDKLLKDISNWQTRRPRHPAAIKLPASLAMLNQLALNKAKNIAVLLPLTGPLANAGVAIRDGLLTQWFLNKKNDTDSAIAFYDTHNTPDIRQMYNDAAEQGAQVVIGPLTKNHVQQIAQTEVLPVPVLALNYLDEGTQALDESHFYQFGLSPEDEARQVAERLWIQGDRNILIVAPATSWGQRVSDAFIIDWELKGGIVTSKALFDRPDQYLNALKNALNIQYSERRAARIEQIIGESVEFEFRRRADVDAIFMLAQPTQARQLKPILNYQRAGNIPVYATSSVYNGENNPDKDADLNGIQFIETPWRLSMNEDRSLAQAAFPNSTGRYADLVAFGADAFRLYPRLWQMSTFNDVRIQGVTGSLNMNEDGRVTRQLTWIKMNKGVASPISEDDLVSKTQ